jgi:hypothetical protein
MKIDDVVVVKRCRCIEQNENGLSPTTPRYRPIRPGDSPQDQSSHQIKNAACMEGQSGQDSVVFAANRAVLDGANGKLVDILTFPVRLTQVDCVPT